MSKPADFHSEVRRFCMYWGGNEENDAGEILNHTSVLMEWVCNGKRQSGQRVSGGSSV